MGEKLELEIVGKDSTGKAWDSIERNAKQRATKFQSLMGNGGESTAFGEEGASKSLRGLNHISKGFKEMMEGDMLKGGAAIARGLQHSIGAAFSSIALGAVAALGTAFAAFKLGEFIEEKTGVGEKLINRMIGDPADVKKVLDDLDAAKAYIDYIAKIDMKKAEKEVKSLSKAFDEVVRSADMAKQAATAVNNGNARSLKASFGDSAEATHDAQVNQSKIDEQAITAKETAARSLIETLEAKKAAMAKDISFNYESSKEAQSKDQVGAAAIYGQHLKAARAKSEKMTPEYDDQIQKAKGVLSQAANERTALTANNQANEAEYKANLKKESEEKDEAEKKQAIEGEKIRRDDKVKVDEKKIKELSRKADAARTEHAAAVTKFEAKREALQKQLAPSDKPQDVISRLLGVPNRGAFEQAAHEIDMGMNHGAMKVQDNVDRQAARAKRRLDAREKQILANGERRALTKGERTLLSGIIHERAAQTAAKELAQLEKDAKKAAIKSKDFLEKIKAATEATQAKIDQLMEMT